MCVWVSMDEENAAGYAHFPRRVRRRGRRTEEESGLYTIIFIS